MATRKPSNKKKVIKSTPKRNAKKKAKKKPTSKKSPLKNPILKKDTKPKKRKKKINASVATQFKAGNQFWKQRSKHGRDALFSSPQLLEEAAKEYFEWSDANPLKEEKGFAYKGRVKIQEFNKMRAYSLMGLCLYLGCNEAYFRQFDVKNKPDFATVIEWIYSVTYTQKFEGAAADLLNPNIIARDLGLKERTDITSKDDKVSFEIGFNKKEE